MTVSIEANTQDTVPARLVPVRSHDKMASSRFTFSGRVSAQGRKQIQGFLIFIDGDLMEWLKRTFDLIFAVALLIVLAPVFCAMVIFSATDSRSRAGSIGRTTRIGKSGRLFEEYSWADTDCYSRALRHVPALWNVVEGQMSFVGPRAISVADGADLVHHRASRRFDVRPGLICSWWLQNRANIAFDGETVADGSYLENRSFLGDIAMVLRAIPAYLFASGNTEITENVEVLGLPIANLSMDQALDWIVKRLSDGANHVRRVCFINPHCANLACDDPEYREALSTADLNLADGIGMMLAGKITGTPIKQNVNGTDLFPRLCGAMSGSEHSLFLLGGKPGVAEAVVRWIQRTYPAVRVAGYHHGYFSAVEESDVIDQIQASGAGLLLVAFGAPRQDKWVRDNAARTGVRVAAGVGGLFDFYSGLIPRAPQWVREIGMEWAFRFLQEPRRLFKRYFVGNFVFVTRVVCFKARTRS